MAVESALTVKVAYQEYRDQVIKAKQIVDRVAARASTRKDSLFWLLTEQVLRIYITCCDVWALNLECIAYATAWTPAIYRQKIDINSQAGQMLLRNYPQLSQFVHRGLLFGGSLQIADVLQVLWAEASETIHKCQDYITR